MIMIMIIIMMRVLGDLGPRAWQNDFFAPNGQSKVWKWCLGAKNQFLFERVQRGPDGPKRVPNG